MHVTHAAVYLNEGDNHYRGFQQQHERSLEYVTTLKFTTKDKDDMHVLEMTFAVGNGGDPESESQYYVHRVRSISVGDVVVLDGERAYACASFGWDPVTVDKDYLPGG